MQTIDWFRTTGHELQAGTFTSKPGVRGHPDLPPGAGTIQRLDLSGTGPFLDLSGSAGLAALAAVHAGTEQVAVLEASAAALHCARLNLPDSRVQAGLPWDPWPVPAQTVLLHPPADRGTARVELEIRAVAAALPADGRLLLLGHRDAGARRYEKLSASLFRHSEVIRRDSGFRVLDCREPLPDQTVPEQVTGFTAGELELVAVKGSFAAGKLDPGTRQLLQALGEPDWLSGRDVLDLGCGYGLLAVLAAAAGARSTGVDDDLAAVRSTVLNADRLGLQASVQVLHSDLDSGLADAQQFDTVLMNPPFHVGRGVRLDLPRAFIQAARRRLRPGGELWLVANRALPYEPLFADWSRQELLRDEAGFKVLRAVR